MNNPNDTFDPQRYGLITGSKCSVLFPKRSAEVGQRQYAKELANNMFFRYYDNSGGRHTEHGNNNEYNAWEHYVQHHDQTAVYQPDFKRVDFWGGQADCVSDTAVVDFKCPTSLGGWLDFMHEPISSDYYYQGQMYMMLYDKPKCIFAAYLIETTWMETIGQSYPVPEHQRMILVEVTREEGWKEKLEAITPKIIAMRDEFYNKLKTQFNETDTTRQ
jgi:hypothetical protein